MNPFEFRIATQIVYGRESAKKLGEIAGGLKMKKAQIITDKGVAGSGVLDQLLPQLDAVGIGHVVFDEVEVNPTVQTVDKAYAQLAKEGCDGVIAVGGGSPIDAGKSVGVLINNPGSVVDYVGIGKVPNPAGPVICIPTTAGTAAEITDVAVLSDPVKKTKLGMRAPTVAPAVALLDPVLTLSLPPAPTRDSGLDALTHAIESYICQNAWPASEALALKAIELIAANLRRAVFSGSDLDARDAMLMGSLLAGMSFHNTKLCLIHAITGPLGGVYNLPHGASNAIVLPHALRFMLPGAVSKYVNIALAMGENVEGLSDREAAELAVESVEQLSIDVGLPEGLSVYGVKEDELEPICQTIAGSFMIPLSPRRATAKEIEEICRAAL